MTLKSAHIVPSTPYLRACEASGGYEASLLALAHAAGRPVVQINARQVRDFARAKNRLAKTDAIDARTIALVLQLYKL